MPDSADIPGVRVRRDADLTALNTLRLVARTDLLVEVLDHASLGKALRVFGPPRAVLGGGSNVVLARVVEGPVFRLLGRGFRADAVDSDLVGVRVEAGIEWDDVVDRCIAAGAHGIENLALIPGLAGAAPIQNIGAYGVEIADAIAAVEVIDLESMKPRVLLGAECEFGYRDSRFKREPGAWVVTALELRLRTRFAPRLEYLGLADELRASSIDSPTASQVADVVRRIRRGKLPDPTQTPNAGSFFKNPSVAMDAAMGLRHRWPLLPVYPQDDGSAKLSAAWLIESCGMKGATHGGAAISMQHALVMVNLGGADADGVLALAAEVIERVRATFGLALEREPVVIEGRGR